MTNKTHIFMCTGRLIMSKLLTPVNGALSILKDVKNQYDRQKEAETLLFIFIRQGDLSAKVLLFTTI